MEHIIEHNNKKITFTLKKSNRKSICIKIDSNGKIIVSAPNRCNNNYIFDFIKSKLNWIEKKQSELLEMSKEKIKRDIKNGSTFMYLGKEYHLELNFNESLKKIFVELDLENNKFVIISNTHDKDKIKLALEKWYRERTLEIVTDLVKKHSDKFEHSVGAIKVKEQKRRYASCTYKNDILFNWRCSMMREDVIEYIVIHEMCHFKHKNHQREFWNSVARIIPDYKLKHEYLRENNMNFYI